jgi:hypothetical protein
MSTFSIEMQHVARRNQNDWRRRLFAHSHHEATQPHRVIELGRGWNGLPLSGRCGGAGFRTRLALFLETRDFLTHL